MVHYAAGRAGCAIRDLMSAPAVESRPRRTRAVVAWTIKILVSGGLLYHLFRQIDIAQLWLIARTASVTWLAVALPGLVTLNRNTALRSR